MQHTCQPVNTKLPTVWHFQLRNLVEVLSTQRLVSLISKTSCSVPVTKLIFLDQFDRGVQQCLVQVPRVTKTCALHPRSFWFWLTVLKLCQLQHGNWADVAGKAQGTKHGTGTKSLASVTAVTLNLFRNGQVHIWSHIGPSITTKKWRRHFREGSLLFSDQLPTPYSHAPSGNQ